MSDQHKPSSIGKTFKLFLVILVVLLVPLVMDQAELDRETVRLAGRIASGVSGLLFLYGLFTRLLKVMGFVVVLLIAFVVLTTEGEIKLPRVQELIEKRAE
jgi:hypothetical protein